MAQTKADVDVNTFAEQITANIERVVVGRREAVRLAVIGLLSEESIY